MPITGVLSDAASVGTNLDPESFAIYLSNNLGPADEKNELSPDIAENAFRKCSVLTLQLKEKEKQLQICAASLEEALAKWREVTDELTTTQMELDRERQNNRNSEEQQRLTEDLRESSDFNLMLSQGQQLAKDEQLSQLADKNNFLENRLSLMEKELEEVKELNQSLRISNVNLTNNLHDSEKARESERQDFDNKLNAKGLEQQLLQEAIKAKEEEFFRKEESLGEEVNLLKQVNKDLEKRLQEQPVHNVDFEALRLSLNNMHTSQLELSQSNLLKEKESALVQLRETLNEKRAQEVALLQNRHQFELQHLRDGHMQELTNLKDKLSQQIKEHQEEHSREQKYSFEMERLQELYGKEKEEWKSYQDLHLQDIKHLQDQLAQKTEELEVHIRDIDLLTEQHAKEMLELKEQHAKKTFELEESHIKERKYLQAQYVQQQNEWEMQQDKHSKETELLREQLEDILQLKEMQSKMVQEIKFVFSEEIKQLEEQHATEMNSMKKIQVEEKQEWENQKNVYCQEMERLKDECSEKSFQKNQIHSENIDLLKEEHAAEIMHLQEQHKQETARIKEDYVTEKQEWDNQKEKHSQELQRLREELSQKIDVLKEEHAAEIMHLQEQHKQETERLTEEYLKENGKLENHSEELKLLREEFSQKTLKQNGLHQEAIEHLQQKCSTEILQVQDLYNKEKDQLISTHLQEKQHWEERQEEYSKEILQLKRQYKEIEALHNLLVQEKKDWIKDREDQSEVIKQLQENILLKPMQLQEQHSEAINNLQDQHENAMKELEERHRRERGEWEKERDQCSQELDLLVNQHSQELKRIGEELLQVSLQKEEQHSKMLEQLQEEFSKTILDMQNQHSREMEKVVELQKKEKEQWERRNSQSFQRAQDMYKKSESLEEFELLLGNNLQDFGNLKEQHDKEVVSVHNIHKKLQIKTSQEIQLLWSQIDSSRASRQELNELKEQLIARSMHLEVIERMKQDFHKQQQQVKATHEKDMEDLRIYFEQKSRAAEETYRENLELLHQRLREMSYEGKEEMSTVNSSVLALDESFESEKTDLLLHLTDQLVQYKDELSSVRYQSQEKHRQELENVSAALSQHYQEEIETLKKKHSLELEELREILSKEHNKAELAKMHPRSGGDTRCSETQSSFGGTEEQRVGHIQCAQHLKLQKQNQLESIKDQTVNELQEVVKRLYTEKSRVLNALKEAQQRAKQFNEEKTNVQGNLLGETQTSLVSRDKPGELISILPTQKKDLKLLTLEENHRWQPGTCVSDLQANILTLHCHLDGNLYFQSSDLECYQEQDLFSCLSELLLRHKEEVQSLNLEHEAHIQQLEASHLIKLDTLESSYLTEIQKIRDEHSLAVEELEECFSNRLQENEKEIQDRLEKARLLWLQQQEQELQRLRQELAAVHLEKFQAMAKELEVAHQDDLKEKLYQQRLQLEQEKSQALDALQEEVLRMEDHNKLALQELSSLHKVEVQQHTQTLQNEMVKLTGERQQQELQEKVSLLNNEMEELQSQVETIVQTRERENQEGKNLETILHSEVQMARLEQGKLQDSCQRLLKIFTDVLKNTLFTEDLIFKKIGLCLDSTLSQTDEDRNRDVLTKSTVSEKHRLSPDCDTMTEHSLMSTDEGYEVSEYLCDSVLGSLEVGLENEEKIVQISLRLRSAVERLLDMVSNSTVQLEQTREIQKSFEEEFKSRNQEMGQVVVKNQELLKLLAQETEAKNQLQVELHKAQGLMEGYAAEKSALEETLSSKEISEHQLVVELEKSREQLKVLTQEPSALGEEKELLLRLQQVLSSGEKDVEVELLKETQRLVKEKLELHCQADKDRSNMLSHMRVLEMELEDQMARNQELMKKTSEVTDLEQQIQALEKQLKHQRHFMDEQAVEREHERDDFQQEIRNLEEQLKQALKNHGDSRAYRNETSEANVKQKADLNLLIEGKDHLEQQIAERNEEIDKMLMRIQELEQAALSNADAAKKCGQLEKELQNLHKIQKELLQDKESLQQQQYNNVLQISALQSKLDETRHRFPVEGEPDSLLKKELQAEREALQRKEKEIESLAEQLELFREELTNKTEEVLQLNMQLEVQRKQSEQTVQQAQEEYLRLKDEVSSLHLEISQDKPSSNLELLQALLQEKNQEIDHLNEQLLRMQDETSDVEEMRSLVEHLRSDQERLRKSKEEEMEQLHEVIEKLQQELEQLGPIRHEVSDSQESLDQLGLGRADNLQVELRKGARQLEKSHVEKESLAETESLCVAEMESLQQQLEEKEELHVAEIEVLETNLQNLQQSFRQNEQALEFLQLEHRNLQEDCELLRTHVSQREETIAVLSAQLQRLEDIVRQKDSLLTEKELEVQTLQEHNMGGMSELQNQLAQNVQSLEATKIDLQRVQEQNVSLQATLSQSSKEQSEKEKKYKEELEELKQCVKELKENSQKLMEEVQTQTDGNLNMTEVETESPLAVLNEQINAEKCLASDQEAKLRHTENELTVLKRVVEELRSECEGWKTEAQRVQLQLKKKEACVAELHSHSQNLGTQVKKLQEALVSQEAMISVISVDLQKKNAEDNINKRTGPLQSDMKQRSFSESLTDLSAWDSPDMVRKQEQVHSLRGLTPFSELSIDRSAELDVMKSKSSGCVKQLEQYDLLGSSTPSLSDSAYSLQQSIHTQRTSPVSETGHPLTDYDSCDDPRSSRDDRLESGQSDELDYKLEAGMFQFDEVENMFNIKQKTDAISGSGLSAQLQKMLSMVHEESCKILELSERPVAKVPNPDSTELQIQRAAWLKERENLQETIQSLSSALAQASGKGDQESSSSDWRRDLLQSVQALLESEREYLRLELQSQFHHGTGDNSSLSEKVEHLIKEQEEQKRLVLEHVLAIDRSSLLSEIQDLRSQLRMAHLQNQEKLQQLQDALTSAEEKGHTKEHQLRKQVELHEYKLQQEAAIAEDLKGSLLREQERSTEQHKLLLQEQSTVSQLRFEIEELQLELEKLKKQQKEMQIEASKLRKELESKEEATAVLIHTVQTQREVESQKFEEDKNLFQQKLANKEMVLQESYVSLEEQKKLHTKISAALLQEQTYTSNLRKELEIEQSRCKALLAQEHKKLVEAGTELEKEKQNSLSLSSALTLERNVVEQLRQQQSQELCRQEEERQQERKVVLTLKNQMEEERCRARDLAFMIEKTQKQSVDAKHQLESEVQACRQELQTEREASVKLRALLEALQSQKQQLDNVLEQQREREIRLQNERDQYQAQLLILQEKERAWAKEREKEVARSKQTEVNRVREEEQERRIMDLQLQHERDIRRIQELQHMLADLEEQERALASRKNHVWTNTASPAKNVGSLTSQMQRVWQQLLYTVLQVKKWTQSRNDSSHQGYPSEEEVTSLLDSLAEIKLELQRGNLQTPASSPSMVVDVLKRENEELATTVSQLTKEKLELRSQLAKLNRSLQEPSYKENTERLNSASIESVLEAERAVWNREKRLLQIALKHAESELGKATLENRPLPDVPNSKIQRLYRKYLRAESFRKALVYQKKYLLLLLGGFQACEKATLSLIARMGVYPSPGDFQYPAKSPSGLTKFRSAVRAVIAISRLKFLVRKWNKTSRKGAIVEPAGQQVHGNRTDVLQHLNSSLLNSPPTRDVAYGLNQSSSLIGTPSPKPLAWNSRRIGQSPVLTPERSPYTSQDPEHSITEYIHHLEMVQRRLGGLQNGSSPERSYVKYARK
uniref:Pericentrin/AKAP-450 centrosomal targeting domain-containing protein n=1 Tax=Pyxicephalus adspersus TaxID=30357 RepID=A0AAV2ZYT8_PYXAD|nr:TPA: hypothetical protein GDO54_015680 [Pyxicephalus adspersus]